MATAAPSAVAPNTDTFLNYWNSSFFRAYTYDLTVSIIFCLCLSLVAGLAVVLAILRKKWTRLTNFDRLVLALTLWQIVYDLSYLLQQSIVPDPYGRYPSSLFTIFCTSECRDRTGEHDDDYGPRHILSSYVVGNDVLVFLYKWSEIGGGLCSNLLTTTVVWIVAFSRAPSWQSNNLNSIMFGIALLSMVFPLVQLIFYTDGIRQFPYRGEATDDARPDSEKTAKESYDFNINNSKTMTAFQVLIMTFNFIGCCMVWWFVRNSSQKARSQGRAVADSPMMEVSKRLALYPLIQLVTKLPEIRFYLECKEKSAELDYYKSEEFRVCQFSRRIIPSTTGLWFALVWFYFQPIFGKKIRAATHRVSTLAFDLMAKVITGCAPRDVTDHIPAPDPLVRGMEDDVLVDMLSRKDASGPGVGLETGLELGQAGDQESSRVDNPMAPLSLVAMSKTLSPLKGGAGGGAGGGSV